MIPHPLHRLSASPRPQALSLHALLSPCSSRDQTAGDDAGVPMLVKQEEEASEVRFRNDVWGSSIGHFLPSPSSSYSVIQTASTDGDECSGLAWMPSKMRFVQKTGPDHCGGPTTPTSKMTRERDVICSEDRAAKTRTGGSSGGNHMARACSDCNTTTTPLWRSGPRGPKSLCNACGIRQRKARRAMEEAAAAAGGFSPSRAVSSRINGSSKVHNKEKKSRGAGDSLLGPTCKRTTKAGGSDVFLGDFFPRDVTEAAILLMDLSCGFAHT